MIHLVISGGPHAGTYDAKSNEITCTYGFAGPGSWGNQYSVMGKKPNEFSSLQLIVPGTKDAADGTDRFLITVGFGELMQPGYTEHTINTGATIMPGADPDDIKREGTGTATVDDKGKAGKVPFKGKTKDNVTLDGTIDCHQVLRASRRCPYWIRRVSRHYRPGKGSINRPDARCGELQKVPIGIPEIDALTSPRPGDSAFDRDLVPLE
jgi:hypothetical protein